LTRYKTRNITKQINPLLPAGNVTSDEFTSATLCQNLVECFHNFATPFGLGSDKFQKLASHLQLAANLL